MYPLEGVWYIRFYFCAYTKVKLMYFQRFIHNGDGCGDVICIWSPAQKPPLSAKNIECSRMKRKVVEKPSSLSPQFCHGMYGIHALSSLSSHHSILPEILSCRQQHTAPWLPFLSVFFCALISMICVWHFSFFFFFSSDKFACVRRATGGGGIVWPPKQAGSQAIRHTVAGATAASNVLKRIPFSFTYYT